MKSLKAKDRAKINKQLFDINALFHERIPVDSIFQVLEHHGIMPVQEDGTKWSGLLCGRSGEVKIDLVDEATKTPLNHLLVISWYRHEIRYEVTSYVS